MRYMKCEVWMGAINHVKNRPFPSPSFRTALSKPKNLSYFNLKITYVDLVQKRVKIGQGYGPSALIPGSQKSPGSEKTPPRRQPEKSTRSGINLLELRPPKNTVTPVGHGLVFFVPPPVGWIGSKHHTDSSNRGCARLARRFWSGAVRNLAGSPAEALAAKAGERGQEE